jgi:hypothetical protein
MPNAAKHETPVLGRVNRKGEVSCSRITGERLRRFRDAGKPRKMPSATRPLELARLVAVQWSAVSYPLLDLRDSNTTLRS